MPSCKQALGARLRRARGSGATPKVHAMVEAMDEETARQWWVLVQAIEEDARSSGAREGARRPWTGGR